MGRPKNVEMTRARGRFCIKVDHVDIEQTQIEHGGSMGVRDAAIAAAWNKPSVLALKKVFDANRIPLRVKGASEGPNKNWIVVFLMGVADNDNAEERA